MLESELSMPGHISRGYPILNPVSASLLELVDEHGGIPLLVRAVCVVKRNLDPKIYRIGFAQRSHEDCIEVLIGVKGTKSTNHDEAWTDTMADWDRIRPRWEAKASQCRCVIQFVEEEIL